MYGRFVEFPQRSGSALKPPMACPSTGALLVARSQKKISREESNV